MTGRDFQLPTEAEWKYATRCENMSENNKYSVNDEINDVAYYDDAVYNNAPRECRVSHRNRSKPNTKSEYLGLRLVL